MPRPSAPGPDAHGPVLSLLVKVALEPLHPHGSVALEPARDHRAQRSDLELPRVRGRLIPLEGRKESTMARSHKPTPEFRRRLVEMVRSGRSPEELAKKFEPTAQSIRNWVAQADRDAGRRSDGLTTEEHEELRRLRRENRTLREDRDIQRKAAAWFAREAARGAWNQGIGFVRSWPLGALRRAGSALPRAALLHGTEGETPCPAP